MKKTELTKTRNSIVEVQALFKLLVISFFFLISFAAISQTTYHVVVDGTGSGASWSDASGDLQLIINNASSGDQIWVAEGTYHPIRLSYDLNTITPEDRANAFVLKAGVEIYGGFQGNESTIDERNWRTNETILSGDFNNDDEISGFGESLAIINNDENAFSVIISAGDAAEGSAILNGFTVTGGNANVVGSNTVNGVSINTRVGGGIHNRVSSPILENLKITGNMSAYLGGGVGTIQNESNILIKNSTISLNHNNGTSFAQGGGIYADANAPLRMLNVDVLGNKGPSGAGVGVIGGSGEINLTNVTIYGNASTNINGSGGIQSSGALTVFNVNNSIIYGNMAENNTNIFVSSGIITFTHSLVEGSGGSSNWDISNTVDNGNNIDVDPEFVDGENGDVSLSEGSAAINVGDNALYTAAGGDVEEDTDINGNNRVVDGIIDIGAHEFMDLPICTLVCPDDIIVAIPDGQSEIEVNYEVNFDCDNEVGVELVLVEGLISGSDFPLGETLVTYSLEYEGEVLETCSFLVTVETELGINDLDNKGVSFYPNPVNDVLNISYKNTIENIVVYDITGKQVLEIKQNDTKSVKINMSGLTSGVYLARIVSEKLTQSFKIIKQ